MKKEILLSNNGYKITCIVENNNVSFEMDKDIEFLKELIHTHRVGNHSLSFVGLKKFLKITDNDIEQINFISNNEISLLKVIYNHLKSKNKSVDIVEEYYSLKNKINGDKPKYNINDIYNIEYTSNLIEVLNSNEFIDFCNAFEISYPVVDNDYIDFNSKKDIKYSDIKNKNNFLSSISIDNNRLNALNNRRELIRRCSLVYEDAMKNDDDWINIELELKRLEVEFSEKLNELKKQPKSEEKSKKIDTLNKKMNEIRHIRSNKALNEVYYMLFEISLRKFKNNNSLIDFENTRILENLSKKSKDSEKVKFLVDLDIGKTIKEFNKSSEKLEQLLNNNKIGGINLTNNFNIDSSIDLNNKIESILPIISIHSNKLIRISSNSLIDLFNILSSIDKVNNDIKTASKEVFGEELGIDFTSIRIPYNNIINNEELVDIIKKMNVILEINVKSKEDIAKKSNITNYFDKNKIKYVFTYNNSYSAKKENQEEKKKENKEENKIEKKDINKKEENKSYIDSSIKRNYNSFTEALEVENKIFGNLNDEMKIGLELNRLKSNYNNSSQYIDDRINMIESLINNNDILSAKIMIYLLEKEKFNNIDIYFTSVDYIFNGIDNRNTIEVALRRLYKLIEEEYFNYRENNNEIKRG